MCQIYKFFSYLCAKYFEYIKTMSKRLLLLLAILTLSFYNVKSEEAFYTGTTFFTQDDNFFQHTVERGQTVYSIAAMYSVTVDDIYQWNPESKKVIHVGDVLKIPQQSSSYIYHTIEPQETLYALAQKYHMKGEDIIAANPGLSTKTFTIGKIIRIPTNLVTTPIQGGNETTNRSKTNSLLSQSAPVNNVNIIKIALLLPFGLKEGNTVQNSPKNRMVEYYEGFLLALKDLKKSGISVNLQVYDIGLGVSEIPNILKKKEIQDVNLLIGGLYDEQIKLLSRFAKENNIPYILPLTSQSNEPINNTYIYQINTPQPYLYSKASQAFINKYKGDNIIIVTDETGDSNKKDFIELLKQDLQDKAVTYKTVSLGTDFYTNLTAALSLFQNNVIVPSSDSPETLSKIAPQLKSILDNQTSYVSISLFGYPAWQAYGTKFSNDFFKLHTTFYTLFYSDPTSQDTKSFYSTFYKWFSRVLDNNYPKYGMLGYDTGMYFTRLIHTYGSSFNSHINDIKYKGVQTDFNFERLNNWGGFINTNMYLITYNNSDYSISKNLVK